MSADTTPIDALYVRWLAYLDAGEPKTTTWYADDEDSARPTAALRWCVSAGYTFLGLYEESSHAYEAASVGYKATVEARLASLEMRALDAERRLARLEGDR